jgi:seryl-tRNA synthetase
MQASIDLKDLAIRDLRTEILEKTQKIDGLKSKLKQIQSDMLEFLLEFEKAIKHKLSHHPKKIGNVNTS